MELKKVHQDTLEIFFKSTSILTKYEIECKAYLAI